MRFRLADTHSLFHQPRFLPCPDEAAEHGALLGMFQHASVAMVSPTHRGGITESFVSLSPPEGACEPMTSLLVGVSRRFGLVKNKGG